MYSTWRVVETHLFLFLNSIMKKITIIFTGLIVMLLALGGCSTNEKSTTAPAGNGQNSTINTQDDALFVFAEDSFDFGTIKQSGGIVSHDFEFVYQGDEPLEVVGAVGSCLCTEGEVEKKVLTKGDTGLLSVKFNPNLHAEPKGRFFKTVSLLTNPPMENPPEVKVWVKIDLDLGEEFFELTIPHEDDSNSNEISHNGKAQPLESKKEHDVFLEAQEIESSLDEDLTYSYWTYSGTVPGPMMRVTEGDTVNIHLKNDSTNLNPHSIDLHAVNGPGGGAVDTEVHPGEEALFTFTAQNPGLYVYHCASPDVAQHVANGMYGMILVEPKEGLPEVDKEFYVVQGEFYSILDRGETGKTQLSGEKMDLEQPEYIVFNGRKDALVEDRALQVEVGETVRVFIGNGGVAKVSNFHVIGEIFDKVYVEGGSLINEDVQTTVIPAGGASIVEFMVDKPGKYLLVDHALSRLNKGAVAELIAY